MGDRLGDSLTSDEKFALRSALDALMSVARISIPVALYGASFTAQTFANVNRALWGPIVFEETTEWNITRSEGNTSHQMRNGAMEFPQV